MLNNSRLIAFAATTKPGVARAFYCDVLGLRLVEQTPFALVFDANGTQLRIQIVQSHTPAPHTQLGWHVMDIRSEIEQLTAKGVRFELFPHFQQDQQGVWKSPSGALVAWFKDPDGNLLSLTESSSRA
jgi:catechol 2,3-dioxygenase-like lactoylglutathione lyase family enzyme